VFARAERWACEAMGNNPAAKYDESGAPLLIKAAFTAEHAERLPTGLSALRLA
jgi:hypothetical protein